MIPVHRCFNPACPEEHKIVGARRFCRKGNEFVFPTKKPAFPFPVVESDKIDPETIDILDANGNVVSTIKAGQILNGSITASNITTGHLNAGGDFTLAGEYDANGTLRSVTWVANPAFPKDE
jgi:hypothetical protein